MNRPTDKQIEEVLAGIASPEDAKYVAEWFATEEGSDYLEAAMTQDSELIKNEFADLYVDHDIPSKKILEQIRKNIRIKKLKRICFRVAAVSVSYTHLRAHETEAELKSRPVRNFRIRRSSGR